MIWRLGFLAVELSVSWFPVQIAQITKLEDCKFGLARPRKWEHRYMNTANEYF